MTSHETGLLPLNTAANFEFGKRKRWADLVITELVDVLAFVLSPQGKILYCGNGLRSLLGWKDEDLMDRDLTDFVNPEDKDGFRRALEESVRSGTEMSSVYVRMKPVSSSVADRTASGEIIFEVNGRTQLATREDSTAVAPQVFFVVAQPYGSKNLEMLDTFLELREEQERLQERLVQLRLRAPPSTASSPASSSGSATYSTASMPLTSRPLDTSHGHRDVSSSPASGAMAAVMHSSKAEEDDDPMRKKKPVPKKSMPAEQYVCITCGRTDSPEWRKGPLGPKTLCNACGLRWAKQNKVQKLVDDV
ncbi:unnamed protein product [Mycena citricolor]|uniref:White collar 2 protein n=1 Tax=Mycena citricolor TaxID=2018698 RepID=A0AAD2K3R3_9AGAR|nr:unnamed protein product [Mycena citricolor]